MAELQIWNLFVQLHLVLDDLSQVALSFTFSYHLYYGYNIICLPYRIVVRMIYLFCNVVSQLQCCKNMLLSNFRLVESFQCSCQPNHPQNGIQMGHSSSNPLPTPPHSTAAQSSPVLLLSSSMLFQSFAKQFLHCTQQWCLLLV